MEQLPQMAAFPGDNLDAVMAAAIAAGALYCFLGYRLVRLVLFITGFVLAGSVAAGAAGLLSHGHPWITAGAGLLGGIAGSMAMVFVYKAGVFCLGALGGIVVGMHLFAIGAQGWEFWAVLGTAAGAGALALALERFILSLATAAIGAWALVGGLGYFLFGPDHAPSPDEPVPLGQDRLLFLAAWLTLALLGAFFQLTTLKRKPQQPALSRYT
jgi:hypothetical protein